MDDPIEGKSFGDNLLESADDAEAQNFANKKVIFVTNIVRHDNSYDLLQNHFTTAQ